ncbi:hypothetical protein [Embleya sp. NPDC050493]|uniref:hypothetical protein n=1 Tax=Embleya sp. NPDC050493 TaxID=3363989 RepID=UPI0037B5EE2B
MEEVENVVDGLRVETQALRGDGAKGAVGESRGAAVRAPEQGAGRVLGGTQSHDGIAEGDIHRDGVEVPSGEFAQRVERRPVAARPQGHDHLTLGLPGATITHLPPQSVRASPRRRVGAERRLPERASPRCSTASSDVSAIACRPVWSRRRRGSGACG